MKAKGLHVKSRSEPHCLKNVKLCLDHHKYKLVQFILERVKMLTEIIQTKLQIIFEMRMNMKETV